MFQAKFHTLPFLCSHHVTLSRINLHYEIRNQSEFVMALFCTLVRGRCYCRVQSSTLEKFYSNLSVDV